MCLQKDDTYLALERQDLLGQGTSAKERPRDSMCETSDEEKEKARSMCATERVEGVIALRRGQSRAILVPPERLATEDKVSQSLAVRERRTLSRASRSKGARFRAPKQVVASNRGEVTT